jgi:ribosomal protein S18 acetylase RimI-like enzyme
MRLRPFHPDDLETLHEIDQTCFPPGISYSRDELIEFIRHPYACTWVAEDEGRIVGFLIANREPRRIGHVVTIDVIEAWRRHGVGSRLIDAAEEWARKQGLLLIYLETAEDNRPAHRFYKARGYRRVEKIEQYYTDGTAAWVMIKKLR